MESWRQELYHSLRHAAEGSTWKDHKYIAIVDGRYIYPEDVQNGGNSSGSATTTTQTTTSSFTNSKITPSKSPKKLKKQKTSDGKTTDVVDKGSVKTYNDLPKNPALGDMYLLEDTKRYVYWDGEKWTPADESQAAAAGAGGVGGSGSGGSGDSGGSGGVSQSTLDRAREAIKKLNSSSSSSNKTTTRKVTDTHQRSWDKRKAEGKVSSSWSVSSAKNSKATSTGKKMAGSALRSLVSKAVSALVKSNVSAGVKAVSRFRGAQR